MVAFPVSTRLTTGILDGRLDARLFFSVGKTFRIHGTAVSNRVVVFLMRVIGARLLDAWSRSQRSEGWCALRETLLGSES